MNDLIFITHCCFTSHKSLQMEITADNINVSKIGRFSAIILHQENSGGLLSGGRQAIGRRPTRTLADELITRGHRPIIRQILTAS